MSDEAPFLKYKALYRDIIFGYSVGSLKFLNNKRVYVKHQTDLDIGLSEGEYKDYVQSAVDKGLKTEEQAVEFLISENLWSQKNEERIVFLKDTISHLRSSREKLLIKSQIEELDKEIKPLEKELYILTYEKAENIGTTAESFANKKISETTVANSFFKDRELSHLFFSEEEYEYLTHNEINECLELYAEITYKKFSGEEIRKVAVCPFFINSYYLCGDNVYNFFGKPILELTVFQHSLASFGKSYSSQMSQSKPPPEDYMSDPEKIIEWYEMQSKAGMAQEYDSKGEASGKSYFGASKEELESISKEEDGVVDLTDEVKKQGGEMNFDQILKMHGI